MGVSATRKGASKYFILFIWYGLVSENINNLCDSMADQHKDFNMTDDHLVSQARWNQTGEPFQVGDRKELLPQGGIQKDGDTQFKKNGEKLSVGMEPASVNGLRKG
ncbi:hypothetical protein JD844_002200 [Phrynosoma platyrhinos]|uniref:MHC class I antigen n=1 Tax=Phrynosoma platyrhinos TaxID=52577 RepID=A0ABQ7TB34_PHRPL|nr:hypothetical protein JD844_002200 [Phrynosoma platyrhinos]